MIIIIVGGGTSLGAILLAILLMCPVGLALGGEDYKEWKSIEKLAEETLTRQDSFYDELWYSSCGYSYFQKGNYPMAAKAWWKAYACEGQEIFLHYIALAYYCQGDLDTAIDYWTVASEKFPDNTIFMEHLAKAEKAREQPLSWKPIINMIEQRE